jgi:hypothetical protein
MWVKMIKKFEGSISFTYHKEAPIPIQVVLRKNTAAVKRLDDGETVDDLTDYDYVACLHESSDALKADTMDGSLFSSAASAAGGLTEI